MGPQASTVRGGVVEGYGRVGDAVRRSFAAHGEIDAGRAVYRHGRLVVDLSGGYRDGLAR